SARQQGLGRALMLAVELAARQAERSLLVLDTRQGDVAERLYRSLGYVEAGVIPQYARSANGKLDACVFFYKLL
ncbi:MAG: GNAT family N-acetyltransferase, partial [Chloroflexota bacterium]|nr:GNAT family N-acetyltransferase [Chloroflexota bacterium]